MLPVAAELLNPVSKLLTDLHVCLCFHSSNCVVTVANIAYVLVCFSFVIRKFQCISVNFMCAVHNVLI